MAYRIHDDNIIAISIEDLHKNDNTIKFFFLFFNVILSF